MATNVPPGKDKTLHCSFCGKSENETKKLIVGPDVWICDECVNLCVDVLRDSGIQDSAKAGGIFAGKIPRPDEIVAELGKYVIGQPEAKRTLAIEVVNHYKRLRHNATVGKEGGVVIDKSNILLIGPTGSGKTLLAQSIAKILSVPFAEFDATSLTESGYVGDKPEDVIKKLLLAADGDTKRAEQGIVFLDEIDKIAKPPGTQVMGLDVSREGAQKGLVRLIEGKEIEIQPDGRMGPSIVVNTTNILFVCGGAFEGLWKNIAKRLGVELGTSIGFSQKDITKEEKRQYHFLHLAQPEDIEAYGMRKEITGRIPIITAVNELAVDDLLRIFAEPKNALIKQYQALMPDGVTLDVAVDAQRLMAQKALKRGTGGRYLRTAVNEVTQRALFDVPKYNVEHPGDPIAKVVVEAETVETKKAKYIKKDGTTVMVEV